MKSQTYKDIAQAIHLSTKGKTGHELEQSLEKVTRFLSKRRLLSKKEEILHFLKKIINKEEGILDTTVSSVERLTGKTRVELEHFLKKKYNAKEVFMEEKLDPSLLGGIKIEMNDEVIDLTLKNKIGQLQAYLGKI